MPVLLPLLYVKILYKLEEKYTWVGFLKTGIFFCLGFFV